MDNWVVTLDAIRMGEEGRVVGVDMTPAQLEKAERLRVAAGIHWVTFVEGRIEKLPFDDATFDVVISNGVINLAPDKQRVFREAARVLRSGGRLTIADIVTEIELTEQIVCNVDLWASCIGGASQQDAYRMAIEAADLSVERIKATPGARCSAPRRWRSPFALGTGDGGARLPVRGPFRVGVPDPGRVERSVRSSRSDRAESG